MSVHLFYFLSFLSLFSGLMVVLSRNAVHSVLYLIVTFFCLTGHYILLNAQFVAIVNIIVYAGAIMVLFLFVIMFLNLRNDSTKPQNLYLQIGSIVSGGLLMLVFIAVLSKVKVAPVDYLNFDATIGLVENLGKVLYREYLLPFELASVLFLMAMVGAVMLGKREAGERNF